MNKRIIFSWCLYDWANSALPTVVMTFIFSTYFATSIAPDPNVGTSQWGNSLSLAGIIVAFLSPALGAIADYAGRRKPWLIVFTAVAVISSALLWFAKPVNGSTTWILINVGIGVVAFEFGMVFYNAMLTDIAPETHLGRVSGWGWGVGYLGGLCCLAVALFLFVQADEPLFGLDKSAQEHIRITGPLVAVWFAVFSVPLFLWVPDNKPTGVKKSEAVRQGIEELIRTIKLLPQYKNLLIFLISRMIYIDGLVTFFVFGGIYAAGTIGLSMTEIVQYGIAMNVTAGLGAISFAWCDDKLGSKPTLLISIGAIICILIGLVSVTEKQIFWILSLVLAIFVGPIQAASRTLMARLAPKEHMTEMFGLFAFSGKATAFIGPWLFGLVTIAGESQRLGLASLLVFFVVGGVGLLFVDINKR